MINYKKQKNQINKCLILEIFNALDYKNTSNYIDGRSYDKYILN